MYFWKIEELKEYIRDGKLSERDRFVYVLIFTALAAIGIEIVVWIPGDNLNLWDKVDSVLSILIAIVGTLFAFRANGGSSGRDFLGRYFSISFVVLVRFSLVALPMLVLALVGYYVLTSDENPGMASTAVDTVPFIIWYAAIYWRICKHIGDIHSTPQNI